MKTGASSVVEDLKIGVLYSRVRVEEKWIFAALGQRGWIMSAWMIGKFIFDLDDPDPWLEL